MTSPENVAAFHAAFDRHPDDRIRLFRAVSGFVPDPVTVLYPGSYVDIAPSVWFEDVSYVDVDRRANRFFAQTDAVAELITEKRRTAGAPAGTVNVTFHHRDYRDQLPVGDGSVDLLVSLYAGFISAHCSRYLRPGGLLLVNNSHGDASMASLDGRFQLEAVVKSRAGGYRVGTEDIDTYLQAKRGLPPTADELHRTGRGVAYTRSPFGYLFRFGRT